SIGDEDGSILVTRKNRVITHFALECREEAFRKSAARFMSAAGFCEYACFSILTHHCFRSGRYNWIALWEQQSENFGAQHVQIQLGDDGVHAKFCGAFLPKAIHREQDDRSLGQELLQAPCRRNAVHIRHRNIEDDQIRLRFLCGFNCFAAIGSFSAMVHFESFKQAVFDDLPKNSIVICNKNMLRHIGPSDAAMLLGTNEGARDQQWNIKQPVGNSARRVEPASLTKRAQMDIRRAYSLIFLILNFSKTTATPAKEIPTI